MVIYGEKYENPFCYLFSGSLKGVINSDQFAFTGKMQSMDDGFDTDGMVVIGGRVIYSPAHVADVIAESGSPNT